MSRRRQKDSKIIPFPESHWETDDQPKRHQVCVDGEWIDTESVTFINIHEDIQGRDVMTFSYNGKRYESWIITK